jgi:deazaflavin-dependent oxidoreductase (nitroreductase family)
MTTHRAKGGFWITNRLVNPVLVLLLRSPLGRRLGRHLALLSYRGRRSGQRHELVVQYARQGTQVWIVPGQPERKTWWRNLRKTSSVELRLAGEDFQGHATALRGDDRPEELRPALAAYLRQLPRAAKALGVHSSLSGDLESDPVVPVSGMVVVQVDLQNHSVLDPAGHGDEDAP